MSYLKLKKLAVTAVLSACCLCTAMPTLVYADSTKTVTLGADLTEDQKKLVLSYFDIKEEDKGQYNFITINNQEERDALNGIVPTEQIGTKTYSCAYIEPTTEGGINVETTNLTYVTDTMIASALTTAGVENCEVKAASPFAVSGTGALTGAMKAYEVATDQKLDDKKKDIANKEIKTSVDLADEIGDEDATTVINDSKEKVIEDASKSKDGLTEEDVQKIVDKSLAENNLKISQEKEDELVKLLMDVSKQDYDLNVVKNNLEQVTDKLNEAADKLKDKVNSDDTKEKAEETKGFFASLAQSIKDFFHSLFGGNESNENSTEPEKTESISTETEGTTENSIEGTTEGTVESTAKHSVEGTTEGSTGLIQN